MEKKLQQSETETAGKQPYDPPKATFVPLKIEERLMACDKVDVGPCDPTLGS
jgi:hypothetical protein